MNDSELAQILRGRNPWWRKPKGWESDDDYLREAGEAPFEYHPGILNDIAPPGLYVVRGPRRIGKSVELKRAIARLIEAGAQPRSIIYCACNGFRAQDLRRLFAVGRNLTRTIDGPRYWLLDEVTAIRDGWPEIVKDSRDDTPVRHDCVVLTGSSAKDLREAEKALAGRRGGVTHWNRLLLPMGFRSFCRALGNLDDVPVHDPWRPRDLMTQGARESIEELSYWLDDLAHAWELHLHIGGFPRAVRDFHSHGEVKGDFIDDLWSIAKQDALEHKLTDPVIATFLSRIADGLANPLNASEVASEIGISNYHRVNDRIDGLVTAFLAWRCFQQINGQPSIKAQRKVYFMDPVLASLVHRRDPTRPAADASKISEQQIGFTLARRLQELNPGSFTGEGGVMHERTATGTEIDFVGPEIGLPLESKYVNRGWKRDAATIRARYGGGVMLTRNVLDLEQDVWAVPTGIVAWMLS